MATSITTRAASLQDLPTNFSLSSLQDVQISFRCKQQGFRFRQEQYIHAISMRKSDTVIFISAKCHRSQRKSETPHHLTLDVTEDKNSDGLLFMHSRVC